MKASEPWTRMRPRSGQEPVPPQKEEVSGNLPMCDKRFQIHFSRGDHVDSSGPGVSVSKNPNDVHLSAESTQQRKLHDRSSHAH